MMSCWEEMMEGEHAEIEANVGFYRDIIVRCIQEPSVVSELAGTVIDGGDDIKLRELYAKRPSCEATEQLLDFVLQSKEPGKWKAFIDALKKADYPYIAKLLQTNGRPEQNQKNERQMIRIFFSNLEKRIEVREMLLQLYSKKTINDLDKQKIIAVLEQKGNECAAVVLLDLMQCRESPDEWYDTFLRALITTGHSDIVHDMEPTFRDDPDSLKGIAAYKPKAETSGSGKKRTRSNSTAMDVDDDFYDVREHVVSDYEEAHTSKHNMANPCFNNTSVDEEVTKRIKLDTVEFPNCEDEYNDTIYYNYQKELGDKSFNKNVIICEPTGTGKTMIAFYIIDKHLKAKQGKGRVAFMGTNSSLVTQQAEKCAQVLSKYQVKRISADDNQHAQMIRAFLPDFEILFFTPRLLLNNLESRGVNLQMFSMLVFDECHHTQGESPYNNIMRMYMVDKYLERHTFDLPQIVGLTATPGIGKSHSAEEACENIVRLCARMDIVTLPRIENKDNIADIEQKTTRPKEETIQFEIRSNDPCSSILMKAIDFIEDLLTEQVFMLTQMTDVTEKIPTAKMSNAYIQWSNEVVNKALQVKDNDEITRDIISCAEFLNTFSSALEVNSFLRVTDVIRWLTTRHEIEIKQKNKLSETEKLLVKKLQDSQKQLFKFRGEDNPNVRALSNTLRDTLLEKGDSSRAMVFVQSRETCISLTKFLGTELKDRVHHLYGKGKRGYIEGMAEEEQSDTIDKFRDGYYKVLVTTSIGTEGIDIPDCNIALSYNYTQNEIRKVQMQGRSRQKDGTIVTMGDDKTIRQEQLNVYKVMLMQEGMTKARQMTTTELQKKVKHIQEEDLVNMKVKQAILEAKKRQKSNIMFEFRCFRCNAFACNISDIRNMKIHEKTDHHIVVNPAFKERVVKKALTNKVIRYDGFEKKFKLGCKGKDSAKGCPVDWGVASEINGILCYKLKLKQFKCVNMETKKISMFKKWTDVPYQVQEISELDLQRI